MSDLYTKTTWVNNVTRLNASNMNKIEDAIVNISEDTQYLNTNDTTDNLGLGVNTNSAITTGTGNVAIGNYNQVSTTSGNNNVSVGTYALNNCTTANQCVAVGHYALSAITTIGNHVAVGFEALKLNTTGTGNTAVGYIAAQNNNGDNNTVIGSGSLNAATNTSSNNTLGQGTMANLSSGNNNVAIGTNAARYFSTGTDALTTCNNGVYLGVLSRAAADATANEIVIGYNLVGNGSNTATIGDSSVNKFFVGDCVRVNSTNVAVGENAGDSITSGTNNVCVGLDALTAITTASGAVAVGYQAGAATNTSLTAVGNQALTASTGVANTAVGNSSLLNITTGLQNTAIGHNSGRYYGGTPNPATTNQTSVFVGSESQPLADGDTNEIVIGYNTVGGGSNTATIGNSSVTKLFVGSSVKLDGGTVAVGGSSMPSNTGTNNTALGFGSLFANTTGINNTAVGYQALFNTTTTSTNTALGYRAGRYYGSGTDELTSASQCVYVGNSSRAGANTISNEIVIGYNAVGYGSNTAHIGNSSVASISFGDGTGTAFTNRSDRRIKENIKDADLQTCYHDIKTLKVRRFKYKDFVKTNGDINLTGFIADEFAEVFPKEIHTNKASFEDGTVIEGCQSIDQSQLLPTLTGAVQYLMIEVENLKKENKYLKDIIFSLGG